MALLEWPQNISIKDDAPSDYVPRIVRSHLFSAEEFHNFAHWHALPERWEQMAYDEFLPLRRQRMAQVIREGFERI